MSGRRIRLQASLGGLVLWAALAAALPAWGQLASGQALNGGADRFLANGLGVAPAPSLGIHFPTSAWNTTGRSFATGSFLVDEDGSGVGFRPSDEKHFGRAALEVTGFNALFWAAARYLRVEEEQQGFKISLKSWKENLTNGFEWDDNNFITNQFSHPYQGSLYFNAARDNGYDFWQSIPFVFAGSLMWEYFAEVHHPSFNDFATTTFGGISLGEIFYRISDMVLDNRAIGSGRAWREFGGFVINPVRGLNRLITGDASRVGPNPESRFPNRLDSGFELGVRTQGSDRIWNDQDAWASLAYWLKYGDPIYDPSTTPFGAFELEVRMDLRDTNLFNRLHVQGMLYGASIKSTATVQHTLAAYSHFEYDINPAYEYGDQRLGAAFLSGFRSSRGSEVRTEIHADVILLGATKADNENFTGRSYDYGPGLGSTIRIVYRRGNADLLTIEGTQRVLTIVNGDKATHYLGFGRVKLDIPINKLFIVGAEYTVYTASRNYDEFPDTNQTAKAIRAYIAWKLSRSD